MYIIRGSCNTASTSSKACQSDLVHLVNSTTTISKLHKAHHNEQHQKIDGCAWGRSDYTIQCIHWLKGNAFIPRELFCHKFYTQVKMNAVYPAECLLIGEYTYLWGYSPENPQIALCQLFRKGVPSTPKEPWVQPSKTAWHSDSVPRTEKLKKPI